MPETSQVGVLFSALTLSEFHMWQKSEKRASRCRVDNEQELLLLVRYILRLRYRVSDVHHVEAKLIFSTQCILLDDP